MNPDTRLDALVATALREQLPLPTPTQTRQALDHVLARSPGPGRAPTWTRPFAIAAAVVAVLAVVAVAVAPWDRDRAAEMPSAPTSSAPPAGLVGGWRHVVRKAEDPAAVGTWTIRLTSRGVLEMTPPAGFRGADGASYAVTGGALSVDAFVNGACPDLPAGSYRWSVAGGSLALRPSGDPCALRRSVLAGEWHRAGP